MSIGLLAYVGLCGVACGLHRALVFPAPPPRDIEPNMGLSVFQPAERTSLAFCLLPASPTAPVVVFFHGNAEQISDYTTSAQAMTARGIGFCAVEYPGYGALSALRTSEGGMYQSATQALQWIEEQLHVSRERVVLSGWSLGSGVAMEMAHRHHGARVLLLSPYTTLPSVAQRVAVVLPMQWIMTDRFDSLAKAPDLEVPVLVLHGALDMLIPPEMGRGLAARCRHGQFVQLSQRAHGDMIGLLFNEPGRPDEQDYSVALRLVDRFLRAQNP